MHTHTQTIGERIKYIRYIKRMSQAKLAKLSVKSQALVSAHEVGRRVPSDKHLEKYATALGQSLAWLRYGIGEINFEETEPKLVKTKVPSLKALAYNRPLKTKKSAYKQFSRHENGIIIKDYDAVKEGHRHLYDKIIRSLARMRRRLNRIQQEREITKVEFERYREESYPIIHAVRDKVRYLEMVMNTHEQAFGSIHVMLKQIYEQLRLTMSVNQ